ncbi:hypothetical protein R1sor_021208 [Riccia sorocarpa]|uniref:UspA domain-containing protein n=1 Tax=Riccia sorocarpa TaxID=122646 RepID=A0ABD3GI76_9MARC
MTQHDFPPGKQSRYRQVASVYLHSKNRRVLQGISIRVALGNWGIHMQILPAGAEMATRHLGICIDFSPGSDNALKWTLENVMRDNDHVYLVCVIKNRDIDPAKLSLWGPSGSPLIPFAEFRDPNVVKNYGLAPVSEEFLGLITDAIRKKKNLEVFTKVYYGDAREKIIQAIKEIPLHAVFVGSRGLSRLEKVLMGSVALHVVNHSTVPVTIVKLGGESAHR